MPGAEHTHSPTPEEIMEYLDGEGTAASRAAIGTHLAACEACEAIAAEQRRLSNDAQAWTVGPAPASFHAPAPRARLLPMVRAWRPSRVILAGLSAAAAVLLVFSFTARERRDPTPAVVLQSAPDGPFDSSQLRFTAARQPAGRGGGAGDATPRTPAIIRTATLRIVAKDFGGVRTMVEGLVSRAGGFVDQMTVTGDNTAARELRDTLRVPGDRMAETLARLRQIGQAVEDTQGSQDVTDQIVDLDARLASGRATEQRLTELLRQRTGKLSDVLEVERELTRVRLEIERLDAEKTNVGRRVSYATIDLNVAEERKAGLAGPLSLATRIRIAAADGLESALEGLTATLLLVLRAGPSLLLWALVLTSAWLVARRTKGFRRG
jgi:Domain of unknown function (DUF4349)/Putative zinc-finger